MDIWNKQGHGSTNLASLAPPAVTQSVCVGTEHRCPECQEPEQVARRQCRDLTPYSFSKLGGTFEIKTMGVRIIWGYVFTYVQKVLLATSILVV